MKRVAHLVVDYYFIVLAVLESNMNYLDQARHFIWAQTYYKCYQQTTLEQAFSKECVMKNIFSYFSTNTYIAGTQNNRLNEMVLLSTQNIN